MLYVEYLRVRNVLKVVGIVLLAAFAIALIVRPFAHLDTFSMLNAVDLLHGSKLQSQRTLADGSTERDYVDRATGGSVRVVDRGYFGGTVTTRIPRTSHADAATRARGKVATSSEGSSISIGITDHPSSDSGDAPFVKATTHREGRFDVMSVTTDGPTDLSIFFAISTFLGLIVATILGAAFVAQSDGHLEFTFMRPLSRDRSALETILVDLAGLVVTQIACVTIAVATFALYYFPNLRMTGESWSVFAAALLASFAWYGLLLAASASLRRGYGAVCGPAWPAALLLPGLAALLLLQSGPMHVMGIVLNGLTRLDPLVYAQFKSEGASVVTSAETAIPWLAGLTIVYIAAAVLQWRRVEA